MKRTLIRFLAGFCFVVSLFGTASAPSPQDFPEQKPKFDYMSTFLRGRKRLGLKEDLMMKRLLKQPKAMWTIRAGLKHILS
jgi:hypothetical protein